MESLAGSYCVVEGDGEALEALAPLVDALGTKRLEVDPARKIIYHAGMVFASNFVVALLDDAMAALGAADISPAEATRMLAPLVRGCVENALSAGAVAALTGPVARGDNDVIEGHLDAIRASGHRDAQQTYEVLLEGARRLAASTTEKIVSAAEVPASRVRTQE